MVIDRVKQLEQLEKMCEKIAREEPQRHSLSALCFKSAYARGEFDIYISHIDRDLRDGVVFYWADWGWRLRRGWRAVLDKKLQAARADSVVGSGGVECFQP